MAAELVEKTEAAGGEAIRTTSEILAKLSGKDNPQTVLGVYAEFGSGIDQVDRSTAPIWLVAQALRDPGNIGTMLRTGDAVGAGGLFLIDDCADPFSVEAVRASMGAIFTQRLCQTDWQNFLDWKGREPGQLVGLSLDTDLDYQAPRYEPPVFILVGNESAGLPKDYADSCDLLVKIPMHGKADSLNAAISGAVMAYEALSQLHR